MIAVRLDPAGSITLPSDLTPMPGPISESSIVDIGDATSAGLCGGKALGLGRLERAGFAVPAAICLTTRFYRRWLPTSGAGPDIAALLAKARTASGTAREQLLMTMRRRIETAVLSDELAAALAGAVARLGDGAIAVRSSAPYEDDADASHAGIHASFIVDGHDAAALAGAVKRCWASLWTEPAWTYRERRGLSHDDAAMAIVVQRFVPAERSGVAFSVDPLTHDRATVVIDAGWGTGAALVGGKLTPDEYRVAMSADTPRVQRRPGRQDEMTVWRDDREVIVPVPKIWHDRPVLSEAEVIQLARLTKGVERALEVPIDIEWASDGTMFWAVQARPITTLDHPGPATRWTRANLKEIFPELPSPLALSYLAAAMNRMFTAYHTAQGYLIPPDAAFVSVFRGRPYLNLSMMERMTKARGGDPAVVGRLFGGAEAREQPPAPPPRPALGSMGARARLAREMFATFFRTPARGRRLFRAIRRQAAALRAVPIERFDDPALSEHLESFQALLLHERTMRRLNEVVSAQSRAYMVLERLLEAWVPGDAQELVKQLMTGLGTLPNARMTYRLMALGALAAGEPRARAFFEGELGGDVVERYRSTLGGTRCLAELDDFLAEFGHRGPYESDVMSARFSENPAPVLQLIQLYVRAGTSEDPVRHVAERRRVREAARARVRRELRRGRGRLGFATRWLAFVIVCDALQRLLALRDECRHVTTMLVAHLRRLTLEIGDRATRANLLATRDDAFFVTWEELPRVLAEPERDWRGLALQRRRERARNAGLEGPDLLAGDTPLEPASVASGEDLIGFGVSPGIVTGTVKVLHSIEGVGRLAGEIVVFPTIEPTLTPVFPLVRGLIAEMGGLLSHAAILAREYGLPAVVNVRDATRRLRDGDRVEIDGTTGRVRVLERRAGAT
jgi:pyruvate,water dikinase